jgi:hypothetical protein
MFLKHWWSCTYLCLLVDIDIFLENMLLCIVHLYG